MFLSDLSIKRPVFATMLNLALVVFGLFALPKLAIDLYPNVDFPVVTVLVGYPGADPESVEQRVLDPLEKAVNGISGLKSLSSNGFANFGQMVLQFDLEKDSNEAAQQVRDKVFASIGQLPAEAKTPIIQKFDMGGAPILNVALKGDLGIAELSHIAKNIVQPAFERVDGVASVSPAGLREREIQVLVDRERLSSFGLTAASIENSIRQQNLDLPSGKIEDAATIQAIRIKGKVQSAEEIAQLPVINSKNINLRVSDLASVKDTIADEETAAFVGELPTVLLSVQKQSGANTTAIAADVKSEILRLNQTLPKGVALEVVTDNSVFIEGSINSVKLDLVIGALLAIFIVLIFLRDFRITLISATALPTAVIATFAFMQYMGFTLNMMTTLALSLSIGILIDDAIIVVENIHRHLTLGKSGIDAARDATREISMAVIATTLTLCAVFVPVAMMNGIIGRFFFQFGLTVAFAVLVSLLVAFTLTPMLASKFLVHGDNTPKIKFLAVIFGKFESALSATEQAYKRLLTWCLGHRGKTLALGLGVFVVSIVMLKFVPVSFFPTEDRSEFSIEYTLPEEANLAKTKEQSMILAMAIKLYPGVKDVVTAVAASGDKKINKARLEVKLVEKEDRAFSQQDLMGRMRQDLNEAFGVNGATLSFGDAGGRGGGRSQPIQFIFKSDNWEQLVTFTDQVAAYTQNNIKDATDVTTTKPVPKNEYRIKVNTVKAADLGLTPAVIASTMRSLFEGEKIGDVEIGGKNIDVKLRISDANRASVSDIAGISITNNAGDFISLNSVADIELSTSPSTIERYDGQRQITVLSNYAGKDLNAAVTNIKKYIDDNIPAQVTVSISGQGEIMKDSIVAMLQALLLAVILVFMILCVQYESYLAPAVIMAALPLSLTGAFGALLVTGQVMSVYTMIGIILLMGLVTKNGILLIDFTKQKMAEGMSVKDALLEAGVLRLKPILMTSFAAGGGMLPVALGHGVGGEARSPMGVSVIGGLFVSTLLTLVVVPCLFSAVEQAKAILAKKLKKATAVPNVHEPVMVQMSAHGDELVRKKRKLDHATTL